MSNNGKITEESLYNNIKKSQMVCNYNGYVYALKKSTGHYVCADDVQLKQIIMRFIPKNDRAAIKPVLINNVIFKIKVDFELQVDFEKFKDLNQNYINVANGIVDLASGKLLDHDPKRYFTYSLGFDYLPDADFTHSEAFMQFARSSLNYDIDNCKTIRLFEMLGYTISSVIGAEKCFILVGVPNSGKSVILNLLEEIVGFDDTTNIPIDKLGGRFNLGELSRARVNINREISGLELKDMDIFKSICSCERITGENKYGKIFSYKCRCKLFFAGNCLPEIKKIDSSNNEAVFNRLCILYFPNSIADDEKDLTLEQRLFEEKDIIFSAAINHLMKLRKRNFIFTDDPESTVYLDNYKASNQALKYFVQERCVFAPGNRVHIKDFIAAFKEYCANNALPYNYTSESISAYICSLPGISKKKFRLNGSDPLYGYNGLSLAPAKNCHDIGQD